MPHPVKIYKPKKGGGLKLDRVIPPEDLTYIDDACEEYFKNASKRGCVESAPKRTAKGGRRPRAARENPGCLPPPQKSRFKGVSFNRRNVTAPWQAMPYDNASKKQKYLGYFATEEEAAQACATFKGCALEGLRKNS